MTPLPPSELLVVGALIALYLLPSLVALVRGCPRSGHVVRLNLLYGWSGIGWLLALVAACSGPTLARRRV